MSWKSANGKWMYMNSNQPIARFDLFKPPLYERFSILLFSTDDVKDLKSWVWFWLLSSSKRAIVLTKGIWRIRFKTVSAMDEFWLAEAIATFSLDLLCCVVVVVVLFDVLLVAGIDVIDEMLPKSMPSTLLKKRENASPGCLSSFSEISRFTGLSNYFHV